MQNQNSCAVECNGKQLTTVNDRILFLKLFQQKAYKNKRLRFGQEAAAKNQADDDKNGIFFLQDCHGPQFDDLAVADDVQNYELISGYQNDTHTTVEFRRQLDTCDRQDFVISVSSIMTFYSN